MTFSQLKIIIHDNHIPEDVKLLSDSGWECDATDMNGVYYNADTNTIVFTQSCSEFEKYASKPGWRALCSNDTEFSIFPH